MVNTHTFEDDHHWRWYLEDLTKLGFDTHARGSDWMRFLWGDETRWNRILTYRLAPLIARTSSVERLVLIEAIEETGNVLFTEIPSSPSSSRPAPASSCAPAGTSTSSASRATPWAPITES